MPGNDPEEAPVPGLDPADSLARRPEPMVSSMRALLGLFSWATVAVAAWLGFVILFVLPSRDPTRIPLWAAAAAGFVGYSALCGLHLARGPRGGWLHGSVLAASVVAIALGVYGIVSMIRVGNAGGHFEGYVVLVGLILAAHGLTAILYTLLTARLARQIRAV